MTSQPPLLLDQHTLKGMHEKCQSNLHLGREREREGEEGMRMQAHT